MQSKYYTSIAFENNQYIGRVFLASNHQLIYTSQPYNSTDQAVADARTFVITSSPPTEPISEQVPRPITNTTTYSTPAAPTGKCCGRR